MSNDQFPALGFNPTRGNVQEIRDIARQIKETGNYSKEAHDTLKSVKNEKEVWTGKAADAFVDSLGELPKYLDDAGESLQKAGKALSTWADRLGEHKKEAEKLEEKTAKALSDYYRKNKDAEETRSASLQDPGDAELREQAHEKIKSANDSWDDVEQLRRKANDLKDLWEQDARKCSDALNEAADKAPDKTFFDSFGEFFDDAGKWFSDHLGDIGDIAGIISAVAGALAFIPVCAPVAGPVALIAGGVALAAHGSDMVVNEKYDDPNAWVTLTGDVLGVVPGIGAVSKGMGATGDVLAGADRMVDVTRGPAAQVADTAYDAASSGSKAFLDEATAASKDPAKAFQKIAEKATGGNPLLADSANLTAQENAAKALQGGSNVSLQVPAAIGLFAEDQSVSDAKNATGAVSGILNGIQLK